MISNLVLSKQVLFRMAAGPDISNESRQIFNDYEGFSNLLQDVFPFIDKIR